MTEHENLPAPVPGPGAGPSAGPANGPGLRILVTGASGDVGSRLVPRLLDWNGTGGEVRLLLRRDQPVPAGAEPVIGDLRNPAELAAAVRGVDAVVNLAAAFRGVPDAEAWAVNRDGALALGRAARDAGVARLVQISTNLVYGLGRGRPHRETDPPLPGGPLWGAYAQSKGQAERGLLELADAGGPEVRIGRLAFVYGEGDGHLRGALRWAAHWPAHKRMQLVHHADAGRAVWRLLCAPAAPGRVYQIGDDAPVSAVELLELLGSPPPEGMARRVDDDPWHGIVSTARIRAELGWRPHYPSLWSARDAGVL
jgi:nucleoside-diphosphate-sugar epimerase